MTSPGQDHCISSYLQSPSPTPTAAGEHEQCPARSWYWLPPKDRNQANSIIFPKACTNGNWSYPEPLIRPTPSIPQGINWHLMLSTPWQSEKHKPRGTAGPLFPFPSSPGQRGCYDQLSFLMPLQGSKRSKALPLAFKARSVTEAAAVSCQSDCIQLMFPTFILSSKG